VSLPEHTSLGRDRNPYSCAFIGERSPKLHFVSHLNAGAYRGISGDEGFMLRSQHNQATILVQFLHNPLCDTQHCVKTDAGRLRLIVMPIQDLKAHVF
jgi:hypothetical protein